MLVYAANITPRLQYIISFFNSQLSYEHWEITADKDFFLASTKFKIAYHTAPLGTGALWIKPHGLLEETQIVAQHILCTSSKGVTVFFANESEAGFDIFAASFYLLSRYEEYLPHQKDHYGRYDHKNSLAYRQGFLKLPLIDIWMVNFKMLLLENFQGYQLKPVDFVFQPTYDIDMAWSYRHKGFTRSTGGLLKDLLQVKLLKVIQRIRVLRGMENDPYFSFKWLDALHAKHNIQPLYFFLVAEARSRYDKNISPHHPRLQKLISILSKLYPIGLHPSWQSNHDKVVLFQEKKILEKIVDAKITTSRQHYLILSLPDTYRNLLALGILSDYSMGYSGDNGFRASTCTPFSWYDLQREETTLLTVYPFCFMDATAIYYQRQTPAEALVELQQLYKTVKDLGGHFCMVWHNDILTSQPERTGWKNMYEEFLITR